MAVGAAPVIIEGRFPMTEDEWTQFLAVLTAMKPGLVDSRTKADPVTEP